MNAAATQPRLEILETLERSRLGHRYRVRCSGCGAVYFRVGWPRDITSHACRECGARRGPRS